MGSDGMIYVQKNRRAIKVPVTEVYSLEAARSAVLDAVRQTCPGSNADSLYQTLGLSGLISADLLYDQQTTDLVHEESYDHVSTTQGYMKAGLVIVSNGEIVTSEIEQLLDSYKAEYDENIGYTGPKALQWIGNVLLAFSLFSFFSLRSTIAITGYLRNSTNTFTC